MARYPTIILPISRDSAIAVNVPAVGILSGQAFELPPKSPDFVQINADGIHEGIPSGTARRFRTRTNPGCPGGRSRHETVAEARDRRPIARWDSRVARGPMRGRSRPPPTRRRKPSRASRWFGYALVVAAHSHLRRHGKPGGPPRPGRERPQERPGGGHLAASPDRLSAAPPLPAARPAGHPRTREDRPRARIATSRAADDHLGQARQGNRPRCPARGGRASDEAPRPARATRTPSRTGRTGGPALLPTPIAVNLPARLHDRPVAEGDVALQVSPYDLPPDTAPVASGDERAIAAPARGAGRQDHPTTRGAPPPGGRRDGRRARRRDAEAVPGEVGAGSATAVGPAPAPDRRRRETVPPRSAQPPGPTGRPPSTKPSTPRSQPETTKPQPAPPTRPAEETPEPSEPTSQCPARPHPPRAQAPAPAPAPAHPAGTRATRPDRRSADPARRRPHPSCRSPCRPSRTPRDSPSRRTGSRALAGLNAPSDTGHERPLRPPRKPAPRHLRSRPPAPQTVVARGLGEVPAQAGTRCPALSSAGDVPHDLPGCSRAACPTTGPGRPANPPARRAEPPVRPAPQAVPQPASVQAPAKTCFSWVGKGPVTGFFRKLKSLGKGCGCCCHHCAGAAARPVPAPCGGGCVTGRCGSVAIPSASPQASPVWPLGPSPFSSLDPEPRDVAQGEQVLERIAAQGLDEPAER